MILHVHQGRIRQGLPAIILKKSRSGKHLGYHEEVRFEGTGRVVSSAIPLSCGARVWIEVDHAECACTGAVHDSEQESLTA